MTHIRYSVMQAQLKKYHAPYNRPRRRNVIASAHRNSKSPNILPNTRIIQHTSNQERYLNSLNTKDVVICHGPAGTGKTMIACEHSVEKLYDSWTPIRKIVITRPAISVDEDHGYLPGDIYQKMLPWMMPIYDNLLLFIGKRNLDECMNSGQIEIVPLSYIRGRTFDNTLIIADEMQNATKNQTKTLLTRVGTGCQIIITGDLEQSDLGDDVENGLMDFISRHANSPVANKDDIDIITLDNSDVMRSDIVKLVLDIYSS